MRPLTPAQMHDLTDKVLLEKSSWIARLTETWAADHGDARHYELLDESDTASVWLLGWRPGKDVSDHIADITPIHGHGRSAALVNVLSGTIANDDWGAVKAAPTARLGDFHRASMKVERASAGARLFVPKWGVHDMRADGDDMAVTLHVYSPRLAFMSYFDIEEGGLRLAGLWSEATGHVDGNYGSELPDVLALDLRKEEAA